MLYNKLISRATRLNAGECPEIRCSGRSTALMLRYVAECIENPGKWFIVEDHHRTRCSHQQLFYNIRDFVNKMGYKYFEFKTDCAMRCNHFTENPWEIQ